MLVLQRKNGTSLLVASSRYVFLPFAAAANFLIKDVKVILARKIKRRCNSSLLSRFVTCAPFIQPFQFIISSGRMNNETVRKR